MESARSEKRPCFIEVDDGLASLAETEPCFSGKHGNSHFHERSYGYACNRRSLRNLSTWLPRSGRYYNYDARFDYSVSHFLDACFLCNKPLSDNRDIFMYRGDIPFCSEECRQEQIEMDEAKEKSWNLSSSMKSLRIKDQTKSNSTNKTQDYSFRSSTVAAA